MGERLGDLFKLENGRIVATRPHVAWLTVENGEFKLTAVKVAEEVATAEFLRMCEANRIETDESALEAEELKEWSELRGRIVADIMGGRLAVDPSGRPVYTPDVGKPITFNPATGSTLMALETHGRGKDVSNMVAAMADMTGTNKGDFSRLGARDFQACGRIARLFLADR